MTWTAVVSGIGGSLPPKIIGNDYLSGTLGISDEWIRTRTGISSRRRIASGMGTSDLAVVAGRAALESAGILKAGMLLLATSTPDRKCPPVAPEVAWRLGLGEIPACDVNAACSGFVYALAMAAAHLRSGAASAILVIGADAYSTIVDPLDRNTAILFGDGAGAVVVRRGEPGEPGTLVATSLGSDGSGNDLAAVPTGGSRRPGPAGPPQRSLNYLYLNGRQLYLQAIRRMTASTQEVMRLAGWTMGEVEALVAHQANQRILDAVGKELGLEPERLISNIAQVGNTAAASIPLAMIDGAARTMVPAGGRTVLTAFGAGLTWGAVGMTWPAAEPLMFPCDPPDAETRCPAGASSRSQ